MRAVCIALLLAVAGCAGPKQLAGAHALPAVGDIVYPPEGGPPTNAPPYVVTEVHTVDGRDDLAIVVWIIAGMPAQGYADLMRHDVDPPETLTSFSRLQNAHIRSVETYMTDEGVLIRVAHETGHGNDAGVDVVIVRPDNSRRWIPEQWRP